MSNFYFKRSCAIIIAVVFSFVFICSPCKGDERDHHTDAKESSTSLAPEGNGIQGSIMPKQDYTLIIILGVVVVGLVVYLIVKPAKEKTADLSTLDTVLTMPSLPLPSNGDSSFTFTVRVRTDSASTILDGKVSVSYGHDSWRSKLSFKNVGGVARQSDGAFNDLSIYVIGDDVFYVKVDSTLTLKGKVIEEGAREANLAFRRL